MGSARMWASLTACRRKDRRRQMRQLWRQIDQLLRRRESALADGALREVRASYLAVGIVLLAAAYGFFMGWYAVFSRQVPEWRQMAGGLWKMPTPFFMRSEEH